MRTLAALVTVTVVVLVWAMALAVVIGGVLEERADPCLQDGVHVCSQPPVPVRGDEPW